MKKESNVLNSVMLALSEIGCIMHRNNVGAYKTDDGRFIRYGVGGKGGSDLIGWRWDGIFIAIETKGKNGKATDAQINFIKQVQKSGGKAGIARSADDAILIVRG